MIRDVTLSIEPGGDVTRDTNVTLRCRAAVSSSGPEVLTREYTIYKDGTAIYTKTSRGAEDLLYRLDEARVANTGRYACKVAIEGRPATSGTKKLTVTGGWKFWARRDESPRRAGGALSRRLLPRCAQASRSRCSASTRAW